MTRRQLGTALMLLAAALSGAALAWGLATLGGGRWLPTLEDRGVLPADLAENAWRVLTASVFAWLLGYALSFDSGAKSRPLRIAIPSAAVIPMLAALPLRWIVFREDLMLDPPRTDAAAIAFLGLLGAAGGGLVAGFEFGNRLLWREVSRRADAAGNESLALFAGRMLLLFQPGQPGILRATALADFRNGDRGRAAEILERMHAEGRRDPDVLECLCQLASERKLPDRYLDYLRELQRLVPGDPVLLRGLFEELAEQGHQAEALELLAGNDLPEDPLFLERAGLFVLEAGDFEAAVVLARGLARLEGIPFKGSQKIAKAVLERSGEFVPALNLMADQAERMANHEARVKWLEKSIEADWSQEAVREKLLDTYRRQRLPIKLARLLRRLVDEGSADAETWFELADAYLATGRFDEALEVVNEWHRRSKRTPRSGILLARVQFERGALDEAREAARWVLAQDPLADALRDQAEDFVRRVERAQLSSDLAGLVDRATAAPDDLKLQLELLDRLLASGPVERALSHADRLLHLNDRLRADVQERFLAHLHDPDFHFAYLDFLADLQVRGGRLDDALETVQVMVGRSVNQLGTLRESVQRILRRDPSHLPTLRLLAECHASERLYPEAIQYYSLYLANGGKEDAGCRRFLAKAYMALDNYANARRFLLRMAEAGEQIEAGLLQQIIALAVTHGTPEDARQYLKQLETAEIEPFKLQQLREEVDKGLGKKRFEHLRRETEEGRGSPETLEELGDIARALANLNDAITFYQRASREPATARRAKVKLAHVFAQKKLYDVAWETLSEVQLSLSDNQEELRGLMDLIYEIADMFYQSRIHDRSLSLFKLLLRIDAGYRDVLARVESLN
ncbi:MAG: hypothetical protein SF028_02335 [Candidatus Sumerlaeia bacterium]|nr:hypothetical protein [Candidatus Sumerlaeia bacterium]